MPPRKPWLVASSHCGLAVASARSGDDRPERLFKDQAVKVLANELRKAFPILIIRRIWANALIGAILNQVVRGGFRSNRVLEEVYNHRIHAEEIHVVDITSDLAANSRLLAQYSQEAKQERDIEEWVRPEQLGGGFRVLEIWITRPAKPSANLSAIHLVFRIVVNERAVLHHPLCFWKRL